jgi:hypothetical protein
LELVAGGLENVVLEAEAAVGVGGEGEFGLGGGAEAVGEFIGQREGEIEESRSALEEGDALVAEFEEQTGLGVDGEGGVGGGEVHQGRL